MTNPFENIKEPRFDNAYIFDTPKNMFTKGADVHTYGIYSNATTPPPSGLVTGSLLDIYPNPYLRSAMASSNVANLTDYGYSCWAVAYTGANSYNAYIMILKASDMSYVTEIALPWSPIYASNSDLENGGATYFNTSVFILNGRIHVVARNASYSGGALWRLDASNTWTQIATGIIPANSYGTAAGCQLATNGWWGIRGNAYAPTTTSTFLNMSNPRLVHISNTGVITEHSAPELANPADTKSVPYPDLRFGYAYTVSNNYLYLNFRETDNLDYRRRIIYNISSGTPVVENNLTTLLGSPDFVDNLVISGENDTWVGLKSKTATTVGSVTNASYVFARDSWTTSYQSSSFPTLNLSYSTTDETNYVANPNVGYLRPASGWNLATGHDNTMLATNSASTYPLFTPQPDTTLVLKFKSNLTIETDTIAGKVLASAYDDATNRLLMVAFYNAGPLAYYQTQSKAYTP